MRISLTHRAGTGERYLAGCFDNQVGQQLPIKLDGMRSAPGTLVAAEVSGDGRAATLTFDVPDEHWPRNLSNRWSLGFQPRA